MYMMLSKKPQRSVKEFRKPLNQQNTSSETHIKTTTRVKDLGNSENLQNKCEFFHSAHLMTANPADELCWQGIQSRPLELSTHTRENYSHIFHALPLQIAYKCSRTLKKLQEFTKPSQLVNHRGGEHIENTSTMLTVDKK